MLSISSSPSPSSLSESEVFETKRLSKNGSCSSGAMLVAEVGISSLKSSNELIVAQACHFAARDVTDCALCVIFAALRKHMNSPVTKVIEHTCKLKGKNSLRGC